MLNPPVNGKIQGLFKAFECFSSTLRGKFNFQDKPVYSSTFQACANPGVFQLNFNVVNDPDVTIIAIVWYF